MPDFATRLAALGLESADFRRWLERVTGRRVPRSTTARLVKGERIPTVFADALLAVIEKPELLKELER